MYNGKNDDDNDNNNTSSAKILLGSQPILKTLNVIYVQSRRVAVNDILIPYAKTRQFNLAYF